MNRVVPEDQQLLMAGYVLGDLSQEESQAFEQLLAANPYLQTDIAELQASVEVAYGAESAPPARLKNAILAAADRPAPPQPAPRQNREPSVLTPEPSRRTPDRRRRSVNWALGGLSAAAALIAVALGVQNYTLRQALRDRPAAPVAQSPAEPLTFSLAPTEDGQSGEVVLTVNPDQLTGELEVQGLPPLPEDKVYALWTVVEENTPVTTDSKNAILTAVFTVDETGRQAEQINVPRVYNDQSLLAAVAVTVEDAAAPQQHEAAPLFIQRL